MRYQRNGEPDRYSRRASIDQRIDTESGEFEMVMASEGEASDGHRLNVRGISHDETIPLQIDHGPTAEANVGTVSNIRTGTREGVRVLLGVGRIRMTGEGEGVARRRDLVDAIAAGDIRGTSLTWSVEDSRHVRERTSLPKGHPAYVSPDEPNLRRRFGLYFDRSRAVEQSIVAIPSDRTAVIGRLDRATDDGCRRMWQAVVDRIELEREWGSDFVTLGGTRWISALERALAAAEQRSRGAASRVEASDHAPSMPPVEDILAGLDAQIARSRERGRQDLERRLSGILERLTGRT